MTIFMSRLHLTLYLACFLWLAFPSAAQEFVSLLTVQTGNAPLDAVAFSPDGTLLATGGRDALIRLWDVTTGEMVWKMPGHNSLVTALAFSPDGTMLASGSRDGFIMLWRTDTHERLKVLEQHRDEVMALAFMPDSPLLFAGSRDETLSIYDIAADKTLTLPGYGGAIWDIMLSPDGTMLAAAGEDGTIWLYGLGAENTWLKRLTGHEAPVATVAFSPDGQRLVSGGLDGTIRLWDVTADAIDLQPALTLRGHLAPIMGAGFSEDSSVVISASLDGTVRLWDIENQTDPGSEIASMQIDGTPLTALALNPAHLTAAAIGTNGMVSLWDMRTETLARLKPKEPPPVVVQQPPSNPPQTSNPPAAPAEPLTGRALYIPSVNIRSGITSFPIGSQTWEIDPWERLVGHFQGTAWIQETGNIVIGGHSEYPDGQPGIFRSLYNVGIGDEIFLSDEGVQRRYMVINVMTVNYTDLSVVYPTAFNRLTLITCDIPSYIAEQDMYSERLVIIADEVTP